MNGYDANSSCSLLEDLRGFFLKLSIHWSVSLITSYAWIFRQNLLTPQWMEVHRFNRLWTLNACQTLWKLQSWTFNSGKTHELIRWKVLDLALSSDWSVEYGHIKLSWVDASLEKLIYLSFKLLGEVGNPLGTMWLKKKKKREKKN